MNLLPNDTCAASNTCSTSKLACPLCGKPNLCTLPTTGDFATPCWCTKQKIDSAVLAKIPEHLRNISCICPDCAGIKMDNIKN